MSASVVPARAGMSPKRFWDKVVKGRGPRASGDEPPQALVTTSITKWSPRERG